MFKVNNINDLETLYSVLRVEYPNNQLDITYNYNTKEYTLEVSKNKYEYDPEVPVDLNIQVIYGDSVTGDTPLVLRDPLTQQVSIKTIESLCNEWIEYPEFKMFDTTVRLEKQYGVTNFEVWCDKGWNPIKKVIRHKTNKKIYRVLTHTGVVDVTEDHSLCRPNLEKVKPKDLKIGEELLHSFPEKFTTNNFILETFSNDTFTTHNKLEAQTYYYFSKMNGFELSIIQESDDYTLKIKEKSIQQQNVVQHIYQVGETSKDTFVYDLETECGRFNAGVGEITVVNTDSVFLSFKYNRDDFEKNRIDTFKLATQCGEELTNDIFKRPPIELEFEKVFQPFILLTKKRYIAQKYENMKDPFQLKGLDAKGIALTRRDYCKMVKSCYKDIIDTVVDTTKSNNIERSVKQFKAYVDKIHNYDVDIEDLVVSAMLAKSYKTRPVHVILADKLKARNEEVQVGDRIPYIYVESDDPKKQKSELGEDPQYAFKHNLKFNRKCYLEQLAKPILGFYQVVLRNHKELFLDTLAYVNSHLESYGGKKLKESEFKLED